MGLSNLTFVFAIPMYVNHHEFFQNIHELVERVQEYNLYARMYGLVSLSGSVEAGRGSFMRHINLATVYEGHKIFKALLRLVFEVCGIQK